MNLIVSSEVDTACARRRLSKRNKYPSKLDHTNIKITTKYVENESGNIIFTKLFEPKDPSKAKAMILHSVGYKDNVDWATHDIGVHYAQLGYVVFMFDNKGMGKTDGLYCQIDDFEKDIVDPAIWIFNYAINHYIKTNVTYQESIDKPNNYFLSGHSMGGATSIWIALKEQENNTLNIKGMILMAPMCEISPQKMPPSLVVWFAEHILMPLVPSARLIPQDVQDVSMVPEVQSLLEQDPTRVMLATSAATGINLLKTAQFIQQNAKTLKIPMLIFQGTADILTDCDGCVQFFDKCVNIQEKDKEIKMHQNKGHVLWLEVPEIMKDISDWIEKYL